MLCESCGTENRTGSRFCDHCGSPLSLSCPACGEPNRADALFCASCGSSLQSDSRTPPAPPAAERRQVSVLFADLVGFTTFADGRDPERVRAVQQRYFDAASQAITRHGGTVEKFIGDAVMAVWGTPVAHEDDAQRAVRAGLEVVRSAQALGHGLNARGAVLTAEAAVTVGATNQGMVAGDMVNTAARLQAAAEPGQVLADAATRQAAEAAIDFGAAGDRELKGKAAPVPAWIALRPAASRASDAVAPPFVGRVDEMRRLKDLLHAVGRERRIRLVSLTGPAGIGKSRLVDELRQYAEGVSETFAWHAGRSPSYGEGLAFWAVGEMVRRRAGLAEGDDEETTRARVAATLSQFVPESDERAWIEPALLALLGIGDASGGDSLFPAWRTFFERMGQRGSVVLVFEDLQWADSGTVEFIEHLMDWSRNQPVLVLTLARPELLDARPGWGTGRSNATAMALEPMQEGDMTKLLAGLVPGLPPDQISTIVRRAEGMPLYAVEMVRALLAEGRIERRGDSYVPTGDLGNVPLPASLRSLIASRLDALEPDARAVMQHGAVLGQAFAVDALASVTGRDASDLGPTLLGLVRREFLEIEADPRSPERGQYRFVQSLTREVAYDTLGLRDRRDRHLGAARYLEAAESEEAAGALASHYLAALRWSDDGQEADAVASQARISLRAAAERAARLGAHDQAVQNLEHAVEITTSWEDRAELLERAALSAQIASRADAAAIAERAADAYRTVGDQLGVARATCTLADILMDESKTPEAREVLEGAITQLGEFASELEADARLHAMLSRALMRLDENELAIRAADRALVIAEQLRLEETAAVALVNKASALTQQGRTRESTALMEGAIRLATAGGWVHLALRAQGNLGNTLSDDDPRRAMEVHFAAAETARRVGDHAAFVSSATVYASIASPTGDPDIWARAEQLIDEALSLPMAEGNRVALVASRAWWEASRGIDITGTIAEIAPVAEQSRDPRIRAAHHQLASQLALVGGRYREAIAEGRSAISLERFSTGLCGPTMVLAALLIDDLSTLEWLAKWRRELPFQGRWSRALWHQIDGAHAALDDRPEEAMREFTSALELYRTIGMEFDWAQTVLAWASAFPGLQRAREWESSARSIFQRAGAAPYMDLLDRTLHQGPQRRRGEVPSGSRDADVSPAAGTTDARGAMVEPGPTD